jgi:hypothetical protein
MPRPVLSRLIPAATLAGMGLAPSATTRASALPSPAALASLLTHTHPPGRDVLALYPRLVAHQAAPLAPLTLQATDYPIGQQRCFYIGEENNTYTLRSAHLVLKTPHAYWYVEASADGGATWYSLPTAHTTTANPQGANLGNGYTGSSCAAAGHDQNCWVAEQADLSRFAGKRILLRWEVVTDDGYNGQGLALAHIGVLEAELSLDTSAPGWQAAGWLPAANSLAERWLVTALVYTSGGVQVLPMAVGPDGRGSLPISAGASHVVVRVSPIAPETTVPNMFMLSASA